MIADLVGLLLAAPFIASMWFGVYFGVKWLQKEKEKHNSMIPRLETSWCGCPACADKEAARQAVKAR